jgi:hypothetical protein
MSAYCVKSGKFQSAKLPVNPERGAKIGCPTIRIPGEVKLVTHVSNVAKSAADMSAVRSDLRFSRVSSISTLNCPTFSVWRVPVV